MIKRYRETEALCQTALDYINANPWTNTPDICAALGWSTAIGSGRLSDMMMHGDLERRPSIRTTVNCFGFTIRQPTHAYNALRAKTISADEMMVRLRGVCAKVGSTNKNKTKTVSALPPGVYRHCDENRKPIPNQGGQGADNKYRGGQSSLSGIF